MEDHPCTIWSMLRVLERLGYRVFVASNAQAARRVLEEFGRHIHVLLAEVALPGSHDGVALARLTRARWPHVRVLLTSGYPLGYLMRRGVTAPDVPFLPKPFGLAGLQQGLSRALAAVPPPGALRRSALPRAERGGRAAIEAGSPRDGAGAEGPAVTRAVAWA